MRTTCISVLLFRLVLSQMGDVEYTILEELSVSTEIGSLKDIRHLFHGPPEKQARALQFDILNQGSSPAYLFNVTRKEGIISVARRMDRESLCPLVANCVLIVNVLASAEDSARFESKIITIYVNILDINDNFPTFQEHSKVVKISEGSSPGTVITLPGAIDQDFNPEHKITKYKLNNFKNEFSLSATKTLDGSSEIHLSLKKLLDRETNNKYELLITAFDEASPDKISKLLVTVDVLDQNDNEPVFLNETYSLSVDSKIMYNKVILQVSAVDADEGVNAVVTYDFSHIQKENLENIFRINSTTGEISVIGFPRPGISEFVVEALDSGIPKFKAQAVVRVNIINYENKPPRVTLTTVGDNSEQNVVSVLEPGGRGLFVAFVLVDDDNTESVLCQLSSDVFVIIPVEEKGYKIVLLGTVDREVTPFYNLTVTCLNKGDPRLNSTLKFRVNIQDANDNAPVFSQRRYSRKISEGQKNGEFVIQVSARDSDAGANGEVKYSIESGFAKLFSIDQNTGIITAVGDLDRELYPTLTFKVYSVDQGEEGCQNSSAEVAIILEDVNDNFPAFPSKVITIQTPEEISGERIIGNLVANDADEGVNSQLEYFFTGSVDGADLVFTVHRNGSIVCKTKLDREKRANYSFFVVAKDRGSPSLLGNATVVVEVTNINDNAPTIIFPKLHNYTIIISNVPETGTVIGTIIAYDDDDDGDDDKNGGLKFTIVSGNEDRAFEISENTGEIKIAKKSYVKNNKQYTVCVIVSDDGLPIRFTTTCIKIDVLIGSLSQGFLKLAKGNKDDYVIVVSVVGAVTVVFSAIIVASIWVVLRKSKKAERTYAQERASPDFHGGYLDHDVKVMKASHENEIVSHNKECNAGKISSNNGESVENIFSYNENNINKILPYNEHSVCKISSDNEHMERFGLSNEKHNVGKTSNGLHNVDDTLPQKVGSILSSPPGEYDKSRRSGIYIPESHFYPDFHNVSTKRKSVNFNLEDSPKPSHKYPHVFLWNDLQPFMTFNPSSGISSDEGLVYPRVPNGDQGDDVISDISGDSVTTDSGRGNSFDDVNFSHSSKRDNRTDSPLRRDSGEIKSPNNAQTVTDHSRSSRSHRRFSRYCSKPLFIEFPRDHKQPISYNEACSNISSQPVKIDKKYPNSPHQLNPFSANKSTNRQPDVNSFGTTNQIYTTSSENIATTTTSGSYIVSPGAIRIDTFVGADVFV